VGLDYTALYQVAATLGIEIGPGLLKKIQALEHAALNRKK
jgi:hypothetical protein